MVWPVMLASDLKFEDSPDAGDPACLCSRCGKVIEAKDAPAVRFFVDYGGAEYRYHFDCLT